MDLWQWDKLLVFLAFFVPGFVMMKVYDLRVAAEKRDIAKSIFEVVAYSAINYMFALPPLLLLLRGGYLQNGWVLWASALVTTLLLPALLASVFWVAVTHTPLAGLVVAPDKKPWDFVFGLRRPYWVLLHMKSSKKIGGLYGFSSFASSYPAEEQIFLEQVWSVDDDGIFLEPAERSSGVVVCMDDVEAIELFEYQDKKEG